MTLKTSVIGVKELQNSLNRFKKGRSKDSQKLLGQISNLCVQEAQRNFSSAQYDGNNDVSVSRLTSLGESTVKATGKSVTFIEFGTGTKYTAAHPKAGQFGFARGTFGKGLGANPPWFYNGNPGTNGILVSGKKKPTVKTFGNPANKCMYNAAKEVRKQLRILAEQFYNTR